MAHLPGQSVTVEDDEWGNTCDSHPTVIATHRICTESDSFGSEYANLCDVCWDERKQAIAEKAENPDEWETCKCGNSQPSLISYRDYEEGSHGPVYEHCSKCHEKMNARIAKELEDEPDYPDVYNADDFIDYSEYDEPLHVHHVDLDQEQVDFIIAYLRSEWRLNFKQDEKDPSYIYLEVKGTKAYRKLKRRLNMFVFVDVVEGNIVAPVVCGALTHSRCSVEVTCIDNKTNSRALIAARKRKALTIAELFQHAKNKTRPPRPKLGKEFITPEFTLGLSLQMVHY